MTGFFHNDKNANTQFEQKGYYVLNVGKDIPNKLIELYHSLYPAGPVEFYGNHRSESSEFNHMVNELISQIVDPALETMQIDYSPVFGSFAIKPAFYDQEFNLHQDWNIVNEEKYNSAQIWIPLIDTDSSNGGLFVLPRSHLFFKNYRSATLPIAQIPRKGLLKYLAPVISLKKGQALIFKHSLFHGSVANQTAQERPAVIFSVMEANADMLYYQKQNEKTVNIYAIDPNFYLSYVPQIEIGHIPQGYKIIGSLYYNWFDIKLSDILKKVLRFLILG